MELRQLIYFMAIVEHQTMHAASEALLISQPALSRSLSNLEDELGLQLFDREKKRLVLNENGEMVLPYIKRILKDVHKLETDLAEYQKNRHRIEIASLAPAPLWGLTYLYHQHYPEMPLNQTLLSDTQALLDGLEKHLYTLIILNHKLSLAHYQCQPLFKETLHIAVQSDHPLAAKTSITFQELDGTHFLTLKGIGYWEKIHQYMPHSRFLEQEDPQTYTTLHLSTVFPVFRSNLTITRFSLMEDKIYIPISAPEASMTFYALYPDQLKEIYAPVLQLIHTIPWEKYREKEHF